MTFSRRTFLTGLAATLAAPTIVRAASLMPVRGIVMNVAPMAEPKVWTFHARRYIWVEGSQMIHFSEVGEDAPWEYKARFA